MVDVTISGSKFKGAVLYYTSWWDCGGINFKIGGINPTCRHPKPRPTTPRDFFYSYLFLYQKQKLGKTSKQPFKKRIPTEPHNNGSFVICEIKGLFGWGNEWGKVKVTQIYFLIVVSFLCSGFKSITLLLRCPIGCTVHIRHGTPDQV